MVNVIKDSFDKEFRPDWGGGAITYGANFLERLQKWLDSFDDAQILTTFGPISLNDGFLKIHTKRKATGFSGSEGCWTILMGGSEHLLAELSKKLDSLGQNQANHDKQIRALEKTSSSHDLQIRAAEINAKQFHSNVAVHEKQIGELGARLNDMERRLRSPYLY